MAEVHSINEQTMNLLRSTATSAERNVIEQIKRQTCECVLKVQVLVLLPGITVILSLVSVKGHCTTMISGKVASPLEGEVLNKSFIIPCSYVSKIKI